jgi:hypothetical protein
MPLSIIFQLYHGRKKNEKDINVDSTTACLMVTQQMFSFGAGITTHSKNRAT